MKKALILGITDGSALAEFLLAKGYEVHGIVRHASTNSDRLDHIYADRHDTGVHLEYDLDLAQQEQTAAYHRLMQQGLSHG